MQKKILILGASSDIGFETVKYFLKNNWSVTAHFNKNKIKLNKLKNKKLDLFKFNLTKINSFKKYLDKNSKDLSNFDAFVSLTGYMKIKKFDKILPPDLIDHINANYISNLLIIQKILKNMRKNKWGRILLASSIGTKFGGGNLTMAYSISKYLNEFFPSAYKEYYKYNIMINALKIGVTDTKLHSKDKSKNMIKRIKLIPTNKMASTKQVAEYIYFLCSDKNALITNEVINISGGE